MTEKSILRSVTFGGIALATVVQLLEIFGVVPDGSAKKIADTLQTGGLATAGLGLRRAVGTQEKVRFMGKPADGINP